MQAVFVFNNLKVNTFYLNDGPFPGFELLTWEHESFTNGTLWDIGQDAGYTPIGIAQVYGQVWLCHNTQQMTELEYFMGVKSGLTEPMKTDCYIMNSDIVEKINVTVFRLREIKNIYTIVADGRWMIKRSSL